MADDLSAKLAEIFGIEVITPDHYVHALTHPSFMQEKNLPYDMCYERLEFLGDAVLKLLVSKILMEKYPDYSEGEMSKIRSIVVSDSILSKIAVNLGLDNLILASSHEKKQGITHIESVTACVFEALLGAFFMDGKLQDLNRFLELQLSPYIVDVDENFERFNAKAILQEFTQGLTKETPVYKLVGEYGPPHNKCFEVEVLYRDEIVATGKGKSKKIAQQNAAYEACRKLGALKHE